MCRLNASADCLNSEISTPHIRKFLLTKIKKNFETSTFEEIDEFFDFILERKLIYLIFPRFMFHILRCLAEH